MPYVTEDGKLRYIEPEYDPELDPMDVRMSCCQQWEHESDVFAHECPQTVNF